MTDERIHPAQKPDEKKSTFLKRRVRATSGVHEIFNQLQEDAERVPVKEAFKKARHQFNLTVFRTNPQ